MEVPSVKTPRLELVSLSPEVLKALLAGRLAEAEEATGLRFPEQWEAENEWLFRLRIDQMKKDPGTQPWLLRAIVLGDGSRTVIGHINFHEPPGTKGAVEIGYTIEPPYRRMGYATEAVEGMFAWAEREHGVRRFIASVSPENEPSLGLIANLGFERTGVQWDELDGEEIVFELSRHEGLD
jgi:ribosomal-protein-alanine N-acetyltransferase